MADPRDQMADILTDPALNKRSRFSQAPILPTPHEQFPPSAPNKFPSQYGNPGVLSRIKNDLDAGTNWRSANGGKGLAYTHTDPLDLLPSERKPLPAARSNGSQIRTGGPDWHTDMSIPVPGGPELRPHDTTKNRFITKNARPMAFDALKAMGVSDGTAKDYADKAQSAASLIGMPLDIASGAGGALNDGEPIEAAAHLGAAWGAGKAAKLAGSALLPGIIGRTASGKAKSLSDEIQIPFRPARDHDAIRHSSPTPNADKSSPTPNADKVLGRTYAGEPFERQLLRAKIEANPSKDPYSQTLLTTERHGITPRSYEFWDLNSPAGAINASKSLDSLDNQVQIAFSSVGKEHQGKGYGMSMYQSLIDEALKRGHTVGSDQTLSKYSQQIYPALKRRGYDVRKLPDEKISKGIGEDSQWWNADSPIFQVMKGPSGSVPADKIRNPPPLPMSIRPRFRDLE